MRNPTSALTGLGLATFSLFSLACASTGAGGRSSGPTGAASECARYEVPAEPGVVPPKLISRAQPRAPQDRSFMGYACVVVTVDTEGRIADPHVAKTNNEEFAEGFVTVLREWRYEPATRDGAPVAFRTMISGSYSRQF